MPDITDIYFNIDAFLGRWGGGAILAEPSRPWVNLKIAGILLYKKEEKV
jgi:hypothetical protein